MKMPTIAALAACCLATPAAAGPIETTRAHVAHADLDLANPRDAARLDRRIAIAARELCGMPSALDAAGWKTVRACRAQAEASARHARDVALTSDAARLAQR